MASPFITSVLESPVRVIMEVKPRDGHGCDLLRDRRAADMAVEYVRAGAPCVSVVTGRWFGGEDRLLREVACATDVPLLKKDFIRTDADLASAKALGASAALLTAGILPRRILRRRIATALREGLTPFVEVASEAELEHVIEPAACVIAINNKEIASRERDAGNLDRSFSLLDAAQSIGTSCPVSASGVQTPTDAARLLNAGFAAVLVGTSLLRAASVERWVDEMQLNRVRPRATGREG